MLDTTSTQPQVIEPISNPKPSQVSPLKSSPQPNAAFSPYWTPIALYYLEREAEWARG